MGEVTDEEIIEIANNFLLNSPPGEFMEVVTDVRALLPKESLINESAPRTFREYNTEQMVQVESPGHQHKVLITKYGEVADGEYVDPRGNQVLVYDHIKQEVTGKRPISGDLDGSVEGLRKAFEKAAFEYIEQHYPHGATTVYGKDGQVIICISSARFNPHNFWNGRWRSVWTFSDGELTGHFKLVVHYYEDGNVQLNTDHTVKIPISESGGPDALAAAAVKAIAKAEQGYQQALDTSYQTMGDTTYKALRRALPITKTKIDWNKIKNYKIGGEMSQK
jgi:capping protein alpha